MASCGLQVRLVQTPGKEYDRITTRRRSRPGCSDPLDPVTLHHRHLLHCRRQGDAVTVTPLATVFPQSRYLLASVIDPRDHQARCHASGPRCYCSVFESSPATLVEIDRDCGASACCDLNLLHQSTLLRQVV